MVICDDAVITHELTVRFAEGWQFSVFGERNPKMTELCIYQITNTVLKK